MMFIPQLSYWYYRIFKSGRTFTFKGEDYRYLQHRYNTTWKNERAVEVPIIQDILKTYQGKRILEVGNVLSHYFPTNHLVVDKYEKGPGIVNQDVVDFRSETRFDLIISISTLEHIGWDEEPSDPAKILDAVEQLKGLLTEGGRLVATLPIGYNYEMDRFLKEGKLRFDESYFLKRMTKDNKWEQAEWDDIKDSKYGPPAEGIVIGMLEGKEVSVPC